jgi:hypothetical protein
MSFKQNFESHPVVFGFGLVLAGFVAGFGARAYVLPVPTSQLSCTVDGLPALEESHSRQISTLNTQLVALESKAADHSLISSYQDEYRKAADRIRIDIDHSNSTYLASLERLSKVCK